MVTSMNLTIVAYMRAHWISLILLARNIGPMYHHE